MFRKKFMAEGKELVGVIGVGRMGLAMIKHMLRQGFQVTVCDVNEANLVKAREMGATIVAKPIEMGSRASFIILAVGYDDEATEVVLGSHGVLRALKPDSIVAVSSTVAPGTVKKLEAAAHGMSCDVLDAPICRGRWFADEGKLLALFGGTDAVVARGRKVYETFCSDISHLGEVGYGQVAKALNNLLLWVTSIGLIEAGRIAEATGIDMTKLREALMMSSGKSQALEDWEQTTFTWALKDMQIVSAMSDELGLSLPLVGAIKELVKEARHIKADNPPRWTKSKNGGAN
jgi:3-hydroxyisobutyrate dehydrogenase-like beta-hydroxyacid dehydrogenase